MAAVGRRRPSWWSVGAWFSSTYILVCHVLSRFVNAHFEGGLNPCHLSPRRLLYGAPCSQGEHHVPHAYSTVPPGRFVPTVKAGV